MRNQLSNNVYKIHYTDTFALMPYTGDSQNWQKDGRWMVPFTKEQVI